MPAAVMVAGSYPPIPVPSAGATLDAVRRGLSAGCDVKVLSPRPSAAHYCVPITGLMAGRRLNRARRYSGCERLVMVLEPGVPFTPPGGTSLASGIVSMFTAVGLSWAFKRFDHTTLLIAGETGAPSGALRVLRAAADEVVEDRRDSDPPPGVTVRGPVEFRQRDRARRVAGRVKRALLARSRARST